MSSWVYWNYFRPDLGEKNMSPLSQAENIVNKILEGENKYSESLWDEFIKKVNKDCIIPIKDISNTDENYEVEILNLEVCVRGLYDRYSSIPFIEEYDSLNGEFYKNIGLTFTFAFLFMLVFVASVNIYNLWKINADDKDYFVNTLAFWMTFLPVIAFFTVFVFFAVKWSNFDNDPEKGVRRKNIIDEKNDLLN